MSFKCVYLLLCLAAAAKAQIPSLGFCPDYLPMTDFKMEQFLGKWYEAERYFTFSEVASRCVVTDYAKAISGRIFVSNEVTNRLTGVRRVINGNLQLVGKGNEAKIQVKYNTTPIPTESTLLVLDTDYDNFAVVWSCTGLGPIHAQNAWLMTRERLPTGPTLQQAYGVLDKFKISRTFFVKTDQEGCALAASDINAANGITATSTIVDSTGSDQRKIVAMKSAAMGEGIAPLQKPVEENKKPESPELLSSEENKIADVASKVETAAPIKPVTIVASKPDDADDVVGTKTENLVAPKPDGLLANKPDNFVATKSDNVVATKAEIAAPCKPNIASSSIPEAAAPSKPELAAAIIQDKPAPIKIEKPSSSKAEIHSGNKIPDAPVKAENQKP